MFKLINSLPFLTLFFFSTFSLALAEEKVHISTKSAVIFNTLCAKCHEGECSGRLTFNTDSNAAQNHIKRYVGDINISKSEVEEFFSLLNHMKKECTLLMSENVTYKSQDLAQFAIPSYTSYFIPLGFLKKGDYELKMTTKEEVRFRIEVISDQFDPFLDQSMSASTQEQVLSFSVDEGINSFVRVRSREPLHITTFLIEKIL